MIVIDLPQSMRNALSHRQITRFVGPIRSARFE
jgi:hypothetical protein